MDKKIYRIAERLSYSTKNLPFVSAGLEGLNGSIKARAEDFMVEEILPYSPCGKGEHIYVTVKRQGRNTAEVARCLAKAAGLPPSRVGFGGRKDKTALTIQTFSLATGQSVSAAGVEKKLAGLGLEILAIDRHTNKIKIGHVAANRFRILLSAIPTGSIEQARRIAKVLLRKGLTNYYGPQRFGRNLANITPSVKLALGSGSKGRPDRFMVSVFQALLFNHYLVIRRERGGLFSIVKGDVAKKTDTGGLFVVEDRAEAAARLAARRIVYTGPIYGTKMLAAQYDAGLLEKQVLAGFQLKPDHFKALRARGTRRPAIIFLNSIDIREDERGLWFEFVLPSGSYATIVMREFIKHRGSFDL